MNTFEIIWLIVAFWVGWVVFDVIATSMRVTTPLYYRFIIGVFAAMVAYTILVHF